MRVILHADDFGYSATVNAAVLDLLQAGRLTSATLLANGEAFAEAARRTREFPGCSFGVHLNITEFRPLAGAEVFREAGALETDERFSERMRTIRPSPALKEAVFREWCTQVERVLDSGVRLSHFDSHHHVHTLPWLFTTLKRLQRKFGVRRVRATINWYGPKEAAPGSALLLKKWLWRTALQYSPATRTTDHFTSFKSFYEMMSRGNNVRTDGVAELMLHPGQPYAVEETKLVWTDWQARMPCPIELINYNDL